MLAELAALVADPGGTTSQLGRRLGLAVAVFGLAWTLAIGAIGAALVALFLLFATWWVPAGAAAATAGAAGLVAWLGLRRRGSPPSVTAAAAGPATASPALPSPLDLVDRYPLEAALAALAAGVAASSSAETRAFLLRTVGDFARRGAP